MLLHEQPERNGRYCANSIRSRCVFLYQKLTIKGITTFPVPERMKESIVYQGYKIIKEEEPITLFAVRV